MYKFRMNKFTKIKINRVKSLVSYRHHNNWLKINEKKKIFFVEQKPLILILLLLLVY